MRYNMGMEQIDPETKIEESLKGTLFVTGGSNGIGREVITCLQSRYQKVQNFDVVESKTNDVRDLGALQKAMDESCTPGLYQNDLVVCAGVFRPVSFIEQTEEDINFVLDVNLKGTLFTVQKFLDWHKKIKHPVRPNIIIMSSISAFYNGGEKNVVYDATKAALSYMVQDLVNCNCIVNALEPGTIRGTKIGGWTSRLTSDAAAKQLIDEGQTNDVKNMNWEATTSDIAAIVEMLLFQNQRGVINGTTLTVDGGQTSFSTRF
jgi:NAD(P)-dependent dehydrogenase (short-subunit alcohol dehydrogenase family)